ncbi:VirK family antimicrobial peptide resistance protein [Salmonella enterica subsp. salamae serovar 4,12:e,n,x:1,6]|nr:VirK family antimicrobial peptide resistance protein [Salmonella enterica subsp. salamae serovar 4,12:e,n,x:1,6]
MTMQQSDMERYNPLLMLKEVMAQTPYRHKRWGERKFRYKFVLRCLINPVTTIKYFNELCHLNQPRTLIIHRPLLPAKIQRPYLYTGLSIRYRARAILEHYQFVQSFPENKIKKILLSEEQTLLAHLEGKNGALVDIYCGPCGYDREGELTLTLCFNDTPLARLSFSFIRHEGKQIALVAGLQGPSKHVGPQVIRNATKDCYGLFPKRMLYEAFTTFIQACNVAEIYAVSENNHVYRQFRYLFQKKKTFVASYSEFWESLNGVKKGALYHLPSQVMRKAPDSIPSKKRAEYRKRYHILDTIVQEVNSHSH